MREKLKDVIAGILSIFFIALVFYLYFNRVFYSGHILDRNFEEFITYNQSEHHSCSIIISEPTIILRMDAVRAYSVQTPILIDEILNRNLSASLGVIPLNLEKDKKIINYLLKIRKNPNIEIAQHGTNHNESDENITEEILLEGNTKIQKLIGVKPITYIPPHNKLSRESREIVSKYFMIISGKEGILKEGENIAEIGYTAETYNYQKNQYIPTEETINECKLSLEKINLCVITIHPQEYSSDINNPNDLPKERFEDFKEMLDKLQELNARFSTFNNLVVCSD